MLFGNKDKFGVEASLEEGKDHLFINYCYWIEGSMVGNIEQKTLLSIALDEIKKILDLEGERIFPLFEEMEAFEIVMVLRSELFGSDLIGSSLIKPNYKEEELRKTLIVDEGNEVFDDYFIFLLECKGYDTIIFNELSTNVIGKYNIPKKQFYRTVEDFSAWIKDRTKLVLR